MKNFLLQIIRRRSFQPLWRLLLQVSKIGMNHWGGATVAYSGEIAAMNYIKNKTRKENLLIFDIGANIGQFALVAASVFRGPTFIYSFEPSSFTFNKLNKQIEGNSRIKTFNIGFGEKEENLKLYFEQEGSSIASLYKPLSKETVDTKDYFEVIKIETIDGFCARNKIEFIDFLKLDIEGHEYFALLGALDMIKHGNIKYIQFEFGEYHIDSKCFFRLFFDLLKDQYLLYRIVSDGVVPIEKYSADLEIFATANYLAELREERIIS
jgi:FkbM family methyltransferase